MKLENNKIAILGLGYVGLPLAIAFSRKYEIIGFDINQKRINSLISGIDSTGEVNQNELSKVSFLLKHNLVKNYLHTLPF